MKNVYILGGGTFSHVRAHLALATPAFGGTARQITQHILQEQFASSKYEDWNPRLMLTKMADHNSNLITNDDIDDVVTNLIIEDQNASVVFFNVALCDFTGTIDGVIGSKKAPRLKSRDGNRAMELTMANKILKKIRTARKDIFLVAFKTTAGATEDEQYIAGLNLLKENSCNIVLANDIATYTNMIIVPEEARYSVTKNRTDALKELVEMTYERSRLHFTRSTVVEGETIDWNGENIPATLREVVNHCIKKGAYKPFRGNTAGHFAYKVDDKTFITSKRKTNFNELDKVGMVKVVSEGPDSVIAFGAKPSVGGQSQRIIFEEHKDVDCIVHFHAPLKMTTNNPDRWRTCHPSYVWDRVNSPIKLDSPVPVRPQKYLECGSHECGKNTSDGLKEIQDGIKAVFLEEHGPNIVFNQNIDPKRVIDFIDRHFDLSAKTGGLVA